MTKFVQDFDVEEKSIEKFSEEYPNITVSQKHVSDLDGKNNVS